MGNNNPYQAPGADVYDVTEEGFDESSPLSPKGRFGRLSYLAWTTVFNFLLTIVLFIVAGSVAGMQQMMLAGGFMMLIPQLLTIVVMVFFSIRRFHDINASGWWSLLMLIPLVNFFVGLVLIIKAGDAGANNYGFPRKTRGWEKVVGYIVVGLMIIGLVGIVAAILLPLLAG